MRHSAVSTTVTCGMLFLSGASAVIFETLWFHQASLTFGNSVWAATLVLCSLMGGLALGNALVGRYGHRVLRPVRFYAGLEVVIAVTGLGLVLLLPALASLLAPVFRPLLEHPWLLNPLRLALALVLMLAPTTAMGATLPFLVGALTASNTSFGAVLGKLYGWNTLGAVVGALITHSMLTGAFGIRGAGVVAAGLNLVAAALAGLMARSPTGALAEAPRPAALSFEAKRIVFAAFLCGATLLALEVVWFRFLLLFVANTSHALAVLLSVILLGIGVGGLIGSAWSRRSPSALRWVPLLCLAAGILVVTLYEALAFDPLSSPMMSDGARIAVLGLRLMLPIACISGILFALLGAAAFDEIKNATRAASQLTLANTVGSLLGAIAGGFILLPQIGMEGSFFVLALVYALAAALVFKRSPGKWQLGATGAMGLLLAGRLALFPFGLMERHFLQLPARMYAGDGSKILVVHEGLTETILFMGKDWLGGPIFRRLLTNGFSMSGTDTLARRYMKLFVYWPVAFHPAPKSALLISYGVGSTAKALTDTAALARIDVVDISRDVLSMAPIVYPDPKTAPLNDPRVKVYIEDGRYFLLTTDKRYDLITAEPPPPKNAGIVNLYTREYFALLKDRLEEGGIATYWLPVHQLLEQDTKAIIAAFCGAFSDCSLWNGAGLDWMLVGSRGLAAPTSAQLARQWADPIAGPELRALGLEGPEQLGALFIGDSSWLATLTQGTEPLEDNYPRRLAEVGTGQAATDADAFHVRTMGAKDSRARFEGSAWVQTHWPQSLRASTLTAFHAQHVLNTWLTRGRLDRPSAQEFSNLHALLTKTQYRTLPIWLLASTNDAQRLAAGATGDDLADPNVVYHRAVGALADRDYPSVIKQLEPLGVLTRSDPRAVYLRAYALCLNGQIVEGHALGQQWRSVSPGDDREFWEWLAKTFPTAP